MLDCLLSCDGSTKNVDPHFRRLEEIENNVRSFMSLQFEHNNFFINKMKDQKSFIEYMNKIFYGHTPNVNGLLNLDRSDKLLLLELALVFPLKRKG